MDTQCLDETDPQDCGAARRPRKLLMIACAFPPTGGPGVQRVAKFAKYLPQFGWKPVVWTVQAMAGQPRDPTLLDELSAHVAIHAHGYGNAGYALRHWLDELGGHSGVPGRFARAASWRLQTNRRSFDIDDYDPWARSSVRPLCRLIRMEGIEAVFSTFNPASNHVLALELKRRTNLPWIADFRDLWTDDPRYDEPSPGRRRNHLHVQQAILDKADFVVGVTPRQTQLLAAHVPDQQDKFTTITNGFDPDDFLAALPKPPDKPRPFVLAYVGRLDRWRTDDALFLGLERFAAQLDDREDRFILRITGHASADTLARLREAGIHCEYDGYVPHHQAVEAMRSADALLALTEAKSRNAQAVIAGKTFEYLASGRPILMIGPADGDGERIIRRCDAGLTVPFEPSAIAGALRRLYRESRAGTPLHGCDPSVARAYSRKKLTGEPGDFA